MPFNIANSTGSDKSKNKEVIIPILQRIGASLIRADYQYVIASIVVTGNEASAIASDLVDHSTNDINQFTFVAKRIFELEGKVTIPFSELEDLAEGDFQNPEDSSSANVLKQTLSTIQGAIKLINELADISLESEDHVTYSLAQILLTHEVGHERVILDLIEDIK